MTGGVNKWKFRVLKEKGRISRSPPATWSNQHQVVDESGIRDLVNYWIEDVSFVRRTSCDGFLHTTTAGQEG